MLKILTLNINNYQTKHGTWETRRRMIHDLLSEVMPDIVALQAVRQQGDRANGKDQAQQLADLLPGTLSTVFAPVGVNGDDAKEGPAVISHLYINDTDTFPLTLIPNLSDTSKRLVLYTRFELQDMPLHLFNGHFSWVQQQAIQNVQQALTYIERFSGPRILVGDLNSPPDSEALNPLRYAGWVDAWQKLHPNDPGFTFESGEWFVRIDYAWLSPELAEHLQDIRVVGDGSAPGGEHISDHCGLLVTLDVEK